MATYTVKKGDTLSEIVANHYRLSAWVEIERKTLQVAAANNISNPELIYVGQVIELDDLSSASSAPVSSSSNTATVTNFGLQSDTDNTLFATWSWNKDKTASYQVKWEYQAGGIWFIGNSTSISVNKHDPDASKQSTYTIPDNADIVRFKVKPVSETKTQNNKETSHWTANWSTTRTYNVDDLPPKTPNVPTVTLDGLTLKMSFDNLNVVEDLNAKVIQFQIVRDDNEVYKNGVGSTLTGRISYECAVVAGHKYKVRCRSNRGTVYSEWSDYSDNIETAPIAPYSIKEIKATSKTSIRIGWEKCSTAKTYDIKYATKAEYLEGSDQVQTVTGIETNYYDISGLEPGHTYFFRVRAVNDAGSSKWCTYRAIRLGQKPAPPTTWSSTTTAIVGEPVNLYWVHNSEDGSSQTKAKIVLFIDGSGTIIEVENNRSEEDKDKTSVYTLYTSHYTEGTKIQWQVLTAGIMDEYSDASIQRTIDVYAPPVVNLKMIDSNNNWIYNSELKSFPFRVYAATGPNTQTSITYHLSVIANEAYETIDHIGNAVMVNVGDEVYSKHFDISTALDTTISAGDLDLENNINYTLKCTVSMNSGLIAEDSIDFTVAWTDAEFGLNAEINIDEETLAANIRPYCDNFTYVYCEVDYDGSNYVKTNKELDGVYGEIIPNATTTTGELVYVGVTADGVDVFYCQTQKTNTLIGKVYLAVYRREFDGSFTEIASGIDSESNTFVTDAHPALDLARYRIVGISADTGAVNYTDLPGYPVECKSVIIQWDEKWTNFDVTNEDEMEQPAWSGSMLKLPYNIDVSDRNSPDVALVEYIGRKHPVSYYGTQVGFTQSWSVTIPKSDKETVYALRRLANWMGDVYVREPSGSGYWANITVSFNQKHLELTIPVTIDVTRVSGGI